MTRWDTRRTAKAERMQAGSAYSTGKVVDPAKLGDLLQDVIRPGDRVALEGDNQKQADFLSRTLADCDPKRINKLHMLISSVSRSACSAHSSTTSGARSTNIRAYNST